MYCPYCGKQNDDSNEYCMACGKHLPNSTGEKATMFQARRRKSIVIIFIALITIIGAIISLGIFIFPKIREDTKTEVFSSSNKGSIVTIKQNDTDNVSSILNHLKTTKATPNVIAINDVDDSLAELTIGSSRTRKQDGMTMVFVPEGIFLMGSSDEQAHEAYSQCKTIFKESCDDESEKLFLSETPIHKVYLDSYWIDKFEVSNGQYQHCVLKEICQPSKYENDSNFNNSILPVVGVDWNQAQIYCEWVGGRLPTEAEWEKAARGTESRIYPWGNEFFGNHLNFCDKCCSDDEWADINLDDGYKFSAPVGSYPQGASPYGVLDLAGNVYEWTSDWYDERYYSHSPESNPLGAIIGDTRVIRGGSWHFTSNEARSSFRHRNYPSVKDSNLGFRCVISK